MMPTERARGAASALAPDAIIVFERNAVHPDQFAAWGLPSRPTKQTDTRAKTFGAADSVDLRQLVADAIEQHVDTAALAALEAAEQSGAGFWYRWRTRSGVTEADEGEG